MSKDTRSMQRSRQKFRPLNLFKVLIFPFKTILKNSTLIYNVFNTTFRCFLFYKYVHFK